MESSYSSLSEIWEKIDKKRKESIKILIKYLENKKEDYIFDPYCRLEYELFNKMML